MTKLTEKQQHWTAIIDAWSTSGLSQSEYCKQNNIDLKRFYTWKHSLDAKKKPPVAKGKFLAVTAPSKSVAYDGVRVSVHGADLYYNTNTDEAIFLQCLELLRRSI